MTDQERQLIETLASRIHNAPAPQIDREADDLIRRGIGGRPDALYILTQTVLIQEMALNQAKAQIDELNQHAAVPPQPPPSFLSRPGGYQGSGYQSGNYPPPPPPQYYEPPPQPAGGRFSGFLHQAATTAAGVVAGELAFSALGSLFGGHSGYMGGGGGFFGGGSGISPVSETIINNNYYHDDRDRGRDRDDTSYAADRDDDRTADDPQAADNYVDDGSSSDDGSGSQDV
jgi:hypothetical protein